MSGTDPWAAVHHEDAEPEPAPAPKPRSEPKRDRSPAAKDTPVPVVMSLMIPADFIAAISALVEGQAALVEQMGDLTAKLGDLVEATTRGNNDAGEPSA
jgi:hypothetical protein